MSEEDLGGHPERGPDKGFGGIDFNLLGEAEVGHHQPRSVAGVGEEQVVRLEVAGDIGEI